MTPGDRLTLTIEKPAAGGRMIARHNGAVVLVSAAIPGETVVATVEKVQRGTVWARTARVIERSADRIEPEGDWSCGGSVFAHVRYTRQLSLKADIVRDALTRIGRLPAPADLQVAESPIDGYRMRARLHVVRGRIGFFREGTHVLCDPAPTRQLLAPSVDVIARLAAALETLPRAAVAEVEMAENCAADQRAIHLELAPGADPSRLGSLPPIAGVTGLSCGHALNPHVIILSGSPIVTDTLAVPIAGQQVAVTLSRHAHSFFQGNRFLLSDLTGAVVDAVLPGRVLDLYAGVGLFSAALAAGGHADVTAVEGNRTAADDLKRNLAPARGAASARHQSVETYLATDPPARVQTIVVDPPRSGMSKEAIAGVLGLRADRLVYVSCDVATMARDARLLVDAGYGLTSMRAFDLFPNTAHVETLAVFDSA
jgi:23S rRNA (uracil1939-C5)-methyltransferase